MKQKPIKRLSRMLEARIPDDEYQRDMDYRKVESKYDDICDSIGEALHAIKTQVKLIESEIRYNRRDIDSNQLTAQLCANLVDRLNKAHQPLKSAATKLMIAQGKLDDLSIQPELE